MNIEDVSPERRNLIVINVIYLTFYVGGGEVGHSIALPILGIELLYPIGPIVVFWIIYCWMVLRYWLVFRGAEFDKLDRSSPFQNGTFNHGYWKSAFLSCLSYPAIKKEEIVQWLSNNDQEIPETLFKDKLPKLHLFKHSASSEGSWLAVSGNKYGGIDNHAKFSRTPYKLIIRQFFRCFKEHEYPTAWYSPWLLVLLTVTTLLIELCRAFVN